MKDCVRTGGPLPWIAALAMVLATGPAGATSFTLTSEQDLGALVPGDELSVIVGLDDVAELGAYTVDLAWTGAPLGFVEAEQLAAVEVAAGIFAAEAFTLSPAVAGGGVPGLASGSQGRAAVLVPGDTLYVDGRTTSPELDPRVGLFAVTFAALAPGTGTLEAGLLDKAADFVSAAGGGAVGLDAPSATLAYEVVPEPATVALLAAGVGLLGARRRRAAASVGALALVLGAPPAARADLESRDLDGDPSTVEAVYDSELDITWSADASPPTLGGSWSAAQATIDQLNADQYLGFDDWRLPDTATPDASCDPITPRVPATGYRCTGSELGHLYYEEFGVPCCDFQARVFADPAAFDLFEDVQDQRQQIGYWSATAAPGVDDARYMFFFRTGIQGYSQEEDEVGFVWPVRDGDVLVEDCGNGVDDDGDGLVDGDDPDCPSPPPPPPVGLHVRCTHDPLYPTVADGSVALRAEALDADGLPVQADDLRIELRLDADPDVVLDPPPPPAVQQANTSEVSVAIDTEGDFAYKCDADRGTEAVTSLWKRVAAGPWEQDFPAVPVVFYGALDRRIDIVFFPDEDEYAGVTDPDFIADVQLLIYEGYYTIPWFVRNQFRFNFWLGTDAADSGPEREGELCLREPPESFGARYAFADSAGIVHRSVCRDNAGSPGIFTIEVDPKALQVVAHESGHRPFGLADEYCCDGGYYTRDLFGPPFPNLFKEEPGCRRGADDRGFDPDACRRFRSTEGMNRDWYLFEPVLTARMPEPGDLMQQTGCASPRMDDPDCRHEEATLTGPDADPNGSVACDARGDTYQGDPNGMPFDGMDSFWWCAETGNASQALWISLRNAGAIPGSAPDPNGLIPCASRGELYAGDPSSDGSLPDRDWYCRTPGSASEAVWVEYNGSDEFQRYRAGDSEIDRFEWLLEQCGDDQC